MRRQCQQCLTDQSQGRIAKNRPTKIRAGWKPPIYRPTKSREKKSADFWCHTTNFLSTDKSADLSADKKSVVWHRIYEEVEVWHITRRNKPGRFTILQVVQIANTSDWRERQWTLEAWNGTKTRTCHPHPSGGGRALTFQY